MSRRTLLASTPIAAAVLLAFGAVPGAWAQQASTPPLVVAAAGEAVASAAASDALPVVTVDGSSSHDGFSKNVSSLTKLGDLHDLPQSVTVLNKALLQSQGVTSLSDALRNVPGITLGGAEGGQIGNNINLNGFTARTDIYLDGFRDRGQYFRDTFALESVEVLMGPSSMLFGRGSTGGVINQALKRPSLKDASEISTSVSSTGMVRATADHNAALNENTAARISVMAQDGAPSTRDEMKNKDYGVAASLKQGINTPTEITLNALVQHNRDMPDYGITPLNGAPAPVDRKTYFGYSGDRTIQDVVAVSAAMEHKVSPNTSWRNQLQYNDVRVNAVESAPQGVGTVTSAGYVPATVAGVSNAPLDQLFVRMQSHDRVIHDKSLFDQADITARFDTGSLKHNLLLGGELGHDSYVNQGYYRNGSCNGVPMGGTSGYTACVPLIDPPVTSAPVVPRLVGNLAGGTANTVAAYVNDTLELSPQFKLVGGLRHDNYQATVTNTVTTATALARVSQTVSFTSVRLGGLWQPSDTQSYYLSYSTSANPSLEQLTNTTGASALEPEKNKAYEVGGKFDLLAGKMSLSASAFQITKENARSPSPTDSSLYVNSGTIRVNGLRVGASGELARHWKAFAGYSYLDATIVSGIGAGTTGMVPTNTPKHSAVLWTLYDLAPHWQIGGGGNYQSSRFLNNTDLVKVGSYARLDATIAYTQKAYDIRLNVFNLTDKFFYDALIQSDGGRAVPGTGRSALLSFTYRI